MSDVKVVTVIYTAIQRRGLGKSIEDPVRVVTQLWTLDGKLILEYDPYGAGNLATAHIDEGLDRLAEETP